MGFLTSVSCGPIWVRLLVASVIVPVAIALGCYLLICSRRATCCCCCAISLILLLALTIFHFVVAFIETSRPLMVNYGGVLLAPSPPVSTRVLSVGLGPGTFRTVQAFATIIVAALRLIARSASIIVWILERIAGLP